MQASQSHRALGVPQPGGWLLPEAHLDWDPRSGEAVCLSCTEDASNSDPARPFSPALQLCQGQVRMYLPPCLMADTSTNLT